MTVVAKVVGPRVLVKPLEANDATNHGIVLPESVRAQESRGMVISVGAWYKYLDDEGPVLAPLGIEEGDTVVYAHDAGVRVRIDLAENGKAEDLVVLHANDVLLVLEDVVARV